MAIQDLTASLDLKQNLNIYSRCKQFDDLSLILSIYDNCVQADLSNYNVRLRAMKADQIPLIQEHIGISIDGNDVTIEADEQLTTTSGKTLVELQFINKTTGKKKATFNLVLIIVPSTIEVNATISTATYTLLQELENKLDQCLDFFENIDEAITANSNLVNSTNIANLTKEALDDSNTSALATESSLNDSNTDATNTKEALDLSITNANASKEALDTSKANADASKVALEGVVQEANDFVTAHGDIIDLDNRVTQNTAQLSDIVQEQTTQNANISLKANQTDLVVTNTNIATNTANIATHTSQIASLSNGSPKGTFATLALLQADANANTTDGKKYTYVVLADGNWYYWNGLGAWTAGGTYQSTGIAKSSVSKETLNGNIFENDFLKFGNIVSTQNYYPHLFVFPVSGNTINFKMSAILKYINAETKLNQFYVTVFGSPTSTMLNTSGLTMLFEDIVTITNEEQSISLSRDNVNITGYAYIKVMFRPYFSAASNMPDVLLDDYSLTINNTIPTITNEGRWGAYTAGTATVTHLITGTSAVAKSDDIPAKLSDLEYDFEGTHLYVSTASELITALTKAANAVSDNWYNIHLSDGTYDLLPFINLASITTVTATGYRGIEVPRYTRLIGSKYRGAKIITELDIATTTTEQQWTVSPLNLKNDAELYNLYVYGKNCRYAVHDDGGNVAYKRYVENCVFERDATQTPLKMSNNTAYGNGLMSGCQEVFKDCVFISEDRSFYCHDNPTYTQVSKVELSNCRFVATKESAIDCAMIHGLGATAISEVQFKQCSFNKQLYKKVEGTTDSMNVIGYGNSISIGIGNEITIHN